jgi:hypothetical protein
VDDIPHKVLKQNRKRTGHLDVMLAKDGKRTLWGIQQLVLFVFVGPPPPGMESRHLDGNPGNCSLENLCYGTHKENMADRTNHGIHRPRCLRGESHRMAKLTEDQVVLIRELAMKGHPASEISEMFSISRTQSRDIINRKAWDHIP